jgi:hypothetical protein
MYKCVHIYEQEDKFAAAGTSVTLLFMSVFINFPTTLHCMYPNLALFIPFQIKENEKNHIHSMNPMQFVFLYNRSYIAAVIVIIQVQIH